MNDTERYLNAATRGLWGRRRRDLRTELRGHIEVRVSELMVGGHPEAHARALALRELGAPGRVSGGMAQVHTLPGVVGSGLAAVVLATAMLSVLPHSRAQVQGIYGNAPTYGASGYLNVTQLQQELQKIGGRLTLGTEGTTVTFPGAERPGTLPGTWGARTLTQDGQTYVPASTVITALQNAGTTLKLRGWENPTLAVQGIALRIQTSDWRVLNSLYVQTLSRQTPLDVYGSLPLTMLEPDGNTGELTLRNRTLHAGHIYALVTPKFSDWSTVDPAGNTLRSGSVVLTTNIVRGDAGQAHFRVYNDTRPLQLFSTVEAFQKELDPYQEHRSRWTASRPAPALLLELSGTFGPDAYTVVPPDQARWN